MHFAIALASITFLCTVKCQSPTATTTPHRPHHTHPTHPNHQHNGPNQNLGPTDELEKYMFHYDRIKHSLVVALDHDCYIMPLSDVQRSKVHDPIGLVTLEADALQMIADNQVKTDMSQDTKDYYFHHSHCHLATAVVLLASR